MPVKTGRRAGLLRELLNGLEAGERIALYPATGLRDGDRVRLC